VHLADVAVLHVQLRGGDCVHVGGHGDVEIEREVDDLDLS